MRSDGIEWDDEKNRKNWEKHRISFENAQYVFSDPGRIERPDQSAGNRRGEERWQTIGRVADVLFVVYTERKDNRRLISARRANKDERRAYYGYCQIDGEGWGKAGR